MSVVVKAVKLYAWRQNYVTFNVVQGESDSRKLNIQLFDTVDPVNLTSAQAKLFASKPDGTSVYQNCQTVDSSLGLISVELDDQICTVSGTVDCWIQVIGADQSDLRFEGMFIQVGDCPMNLRLISSDAYLVYLESEARIIGALTEIENARMSYPTLADKQKSQDQGIKNNEKKIKELAEAGTTTEAIQNKVKELVETGEVQAYMIADRTLSQEKFSDDILSRQLCGDDFVVISSALSSDWTEWISTDEYYAFIFMTSKLGYTCKVAYGNSNEDSLRQSINTLQNSVIFNDDTVLSQNKYVSFSLTVNNTGESIQLVGVKKKTLGIFDMYCKGDVYGGEVYKTLTYKSEFNGDEFVVPVIPGNTYTVHLPAKFNGRVSQSVTNPEESNYFIASSTFSLTADSDNEITIGNRYNTLQFEFWGVFEVSVTGNFRDTNLTRPSQKLVEENFTSDILAYIRRGLGIPEGKEAGSVYYNCQDYGVLPSNPDNTEAFQALVDLIYANGGGTIWIPVGTYVFDSTASRWEMTSNVTAIIEAKSGVSIRGESLSNSILKVTGNTPQGAGLFVQNSVYAGEVLIGATYENFTVDMSEASLTTYSHRGKAFYYSGIKDCVFKDLKLISTPSTSLGIDMLDNVVMDSIYVYEGGRQWSAGGNGGAGIGIGTGKWKNENYIIRNCVCDSCGHFGIFLEDQGIFNSAKDKNYPKGQIIANNVIRNGRNYGIGVRGGKNVLVTGNNLYENKGGLYTDYGAKNVVFNGNLVQGSTEAGFNFGNEDSTVNGISYPCENIAVIGNAFIENAVGIKTTTEPSNSVKQNNVLIGNTVDEQ